MRHSQYIAMVQGLQFQLTMPNLTDGCVEE